MYNIFSTKGKAAKKFDRELEPPTKKLVSEGDILIKKLSEKQLQTSTSLAKQLNHSKQFVDSTEYVPLTNRLSGTCSLQSFENETSKYDIIDKYKSLGLTEKDIVFYFDYEQGLEYFKSKYKNINEEILLNDIKRIKNIIQRSHDESNNELYKSLARQDEEAIFSIKPNSTETQLFKFALNNEEKKQKLPHPMDYIKNVEESLNNDIELFGSVDVGKIRKKARSLARAITNLNQIDRGVKLHIKSKPVSKNSKWDITEPEIEQCERPNVKNKVVFTCKKQTLYTIRDKKIVPLLLENPGITETEKCSTKMKLTIDEIKQIDKFKQYDPGEVSSKLYLKNLHKNTSENDLYDILVDLDKSGILSIEIMKGRMKGQAFIEFKDEFMAQEALVLLNGVLLRNKPIIAQYGKIKFDEEK